MFSLSLQYGGNPVSLAVANAVLDVIERDNLREKAAKVGTILLRGLDSMKLKYKFIGDVRGMGLFVGIDLVKDPLTKAPAGDIADYVVKRYDFSPRILFQNLPKFWRIIS